MNKRHIEEQKSHFQDLYKAAIPDENILIQQLSSNIDIPILDDQISPNEILEAVHYPTQLAISILTFIPET